MESNRLHIRSVSLTSTSNPIIKRIEKELIKLKGREAASSSTTEKIRIGLSGLVNLHKCVDDVLSLPLTQQAFSIHKHDKYVNKLQETTSSLLQLCNDSKVIVLEVKEAATDFHSAALITKEDYSRGENSIAKYVSARKKAVKQARVLVLSLKRIDDSLEKLGLSNDNDHLSMVIKALRCVSIISISVYESLLFFLAAPVTKPKPKSNKWSLAKLMSKGNATCEELADVGDELRNVDIALCSLCSSDSTKEQKLQEIVITVGKLEAGMELIGMKLGRMSMQLIKTRASLLKIISLYD